MRNEAREYPIEARKHVRYRVKNGILAALSAPGRLQLTIGHVSDISESGLAVVHSEEIAPVPKRAEIHLLGHDKSHGFHFKIPAKFVYETGVAEGYRSGFEFSELSRDQRARLAAFIKSNAAPAVS